MGSIKVGKIICDFINFGTLDESKYFTQFNICKNLMLRCKDIKERNIETTIAKLEINCAKIVNTIQGVSIEGQNLTGKKLIIIGEINTKVIVRCPKNEKKLCSSEKKIPFSNFIIVPNDICEEEPINLRYIIEDITTMIIAEGKSFVSITLLIQYIDEY